MGVLLFKNGGTYCYLGVFVRSFLKVLLFTGCIFFSFIWPWMNFILVDSWVTGKRPLRILVWPANLTMMIKLMSGLKKSLLRCSHYLWLWVTLIEMWWWFFSLVNKWERGVKPMTSFWLTGSKSIWMSRNQKNVISSTVIFIFVLHLCALTIMCTEISYKHGGNN